MINTTERTTKTKRLHRKLVLCFCRLDGNIRNLRYELSSDIDRSDKNRARTLDNHIPDQLSFMQITLPLVAQSLAMTDNLRCRKFPVRTTLRCLDARRNCHMRIPRLISCIYIPP